MKVKEVLKRTWRFFEGNKRNIGIIALWALKSISTIYPEKIPANTYELIREGIDILLLGGMADAYRRTESGKKVINSTIQKANKIVGLIKK